MGSNDPRRLRVPTEGSLSDKRSFGERGVDWCHALCDRLTEWLLWFMVVFSPWAFGTTEPWSIGLMNVASYCLGALWLAKLLVRRLAGFHPERWGEAPDQRSRALIRSLAAASALVLLYCLVSAINARAVYRGNFVFDYFDCIRWLPHSYDATLSWLTFWKYLGLVLDFWAVRDWLLVMDPADCARRHSSSESGSAAVPARLRRLLWVVSVNGALLATEGLVQRALGGGRLLGLVEPTINKTAESQFGPFAYRSNGVQYLLLVWPLALGFWQMLARRARDAETRSRAHNNLLPCVLIMAMVPLMALSRAGAVLGALVILAALAVLLSQKAAEGRMRKAVLGISCILGVALLLGGYLELNRLEKRFQEGASMFSRLEVWKNTWPAFTDNPVFGTGPGTFQSIYYLYYSTGEPGLGQAHNDWLEMLITYGVAGSALVLAAFGLVLAQRFAAGGFHVGRTFPKWIYLSMGSCLLYGAVDFPFTIYSIVFLFVVECAVLAASESRERGLRPVVNSQ